MDLGGRNVPHMHVAPPCRCKLPATGELRGTGVRSPQSCKEKTPRKKAWRLRPVVTAQSSLGLATRRNRSPGHHHRGPRPPPAPTAPQPPSHCATSVTSAMTRGTHTQPLIPEHKGPMAGLGLGSTRGPRCSALPWDEAATTDWWGQAWLVQVKPLHTNTGDGLAVAVVYGPRVLRSHTDHNPCYARLSLRRVRQQTRSSGCYCSTTFHRGVKTYSRPFTNPNEFP